MVIEEHRAILAAIRKRSPDQAVAAMAEAAAASGGIDILVCSAGIQRYGTVVETPEEVWDDVLDINLKGIYLAAKYAIPLMKKRGGGAIIAISSVQSYASQTSVAAYTASKGGINALVRAMSLDHAGYNITVNAVAFAAPAAPLAQADDGAPQLPDTAAIVAAATVAPPTAPNAPSLPESTGSTKCFTGDTTRSTGLIDSGSPPSATGAGPGTAAGASGGPGPGPGGASWCSPGRGTPGRR